MKRRYKLILIVVISFLITLIIYFFFYKHKTYILELSPYLQIDSANIISYPNIKKIDTSSLNSYELINKLANNTDNINYYIKNSKLVIINLNTYELSNEEYPNYEDFLSNIEIIINLIKKYNSNIIYIDLYDDNYLNNKLKLLVEKNDCYYISINIFNNKDIYKYQNYTYITVSGRKVLNDYINSFTSIYNK